MIFRGLNFSRNADIGQIGHLWMGTNYDELVKSRRGVMPDLIRHPELFKNTGFRLSPE
jgi:hypothetical protein